MAAELTVALNGWRVPPLPEYVATGNVLGNSLRVNNTLPASDVNLGGLRILTDAELRQGLIQYDRGPDSTDGGAKFTVFHLLDYDRNNCTPSTT